MKRKSSSGLSQLSLFGPLRHIETAIVREHSLMTKYEKAQAGMELQLALNHVRQANDQLYRIQEKRRARNGKTPES